MATKIEVSTHSGDVDVIEVENYDASKINEERNSDVEAVLIGDYSYSRIDIKNIRPVSDKTTID